MKNILVVDDHPAICFAVKAVLAPLGNCQILTASNGMIALSKIKEHAPELIILDIMLSKMDGLQVLQHIQNINPTIKVIIYTGLAVELYAERALRAGASGFYSKDDDISQLFSLCSLVLNGFNCFPQENITRLIQQTGGTPNVKDALSRLSDRELTVLRYLCDGLTNKEIADRLILSNKTISTYKSRLLEKLEVKTIEQLSALLSASHFKTENNA